MLDRLVIAEINLAAYARNIRQLRSRLSPGVKLMAVMKANAYGHGLAGIAKHAQKVGADYLGVVSLGEVRELRAAGITLPILILNYIDPAGAGEALTLGAEITVMDEEVLAAVSAHAQKTNSTARVHLKIDTGMHRAGVLPEDTLAFATRITQSKNVALVGLFTHFASADETDLTFAWQQLKVFRSVADSLAQHGIAPEHIHAANSAATLSLPESHFTMVRPGIATYGLSPFVSGHPENKAFAKEFLPVMTLKTQVIQLRTIEAGETVGYGRTFTATRQTKVALLPVGYGDGFRRAPQNFKEVLIHGERAPILGRVSMDQTSVDVTNIPNVNIHDEVVLLGTQESAAITADDVAQQIGTIDYETITSLAARVSRVYAV